MKHYYDGCQLTDKLCEAMDRFEEKYPNRNYLVEAFEAFFDKEGFYSKEGDRERKDSQ